MKKTCRAGHTEGTCTRTGCRRTFRGQGQNKTAELRALRVAGVVKAPNMNRLKFMPVEYGIGFANIICNRR